MSDDAHESLFSRRRLAIRDRMETFLNMDLEKDGAASTLQLQK